MTTGEHQSTDVTQGGALAAVSNALVSAMKRLYGKGPLKARSYLNDDYLFCVMEGGLTRSEQTLIDSGEEQLVRKVRLRYQEVVSEELTGAVERIIGRKVVSYHSQILFSPTVVVEIFVLEPRNVAQAPGEAPSGDGRSS
jgi:uncharacterized protein YbcI